MRIWKYENDFVTNFSSLIIFVAVYPPGRVALLYFLFFAQQGSPIELLKLAT
ncbi:MAG: hypothetical protein ABL876_07110 [Chitinophagaceae bacterium]